MTNLPFRLLQLWPQNAQDRETDEVFETIDIWVSDIEDPKTTNDMIRFVNILDVPNSGIVSHLRSIQRSTSALPNSGSTTSILLAPVDESDPDLMPLELFTLPAGLCAPYKVQAPRFPARSMGQLRNKTRLWPCLYAPRPLRPAETRKWLPEEVRWVRNCMGKVHVEARRAMDRGELGIATYVSSFEDQSVGFLANDMRRSMYHPLRHSVLNAIRSAAYYQASLIRNQNALTNGVTEDASLESLEASNRSQSVPYLLTSLALFTTHEPCIMCCMALVHSRVSQVFFSKKMKTGGCGGCDGAAVVCLAGINHRYAVYEWVPDVSEGELVEDNVDTETIDA